MNEIVEGIINFDTRLFLILNNLGTKQWDFFWLFITEMKSWIPLYGMFLFFLYKQIGIKKSILVIFMVSLLIVLSDQTVNILKYSFNRFRPCYNVEIQSLMRLVKDSCGGKYGFVSAHASNHFALALFLGNIFQKKYKISLLLLIIWASFVAYSRIYIGVHYPIDVLGGIFLGSTYGAIFYLIYTKFEIKYKYLNK